LRPSVSIGWVGTRHASSFRDRFVPHAVETQGKFRPTLFPARPVSYILPSTPPPDVGSFGRSSPERSYFAPAVEGIRAHYWATPKFLISGKCCERLSFSRSKPGSSCRNSCFVPKKESFPSTIRITCEKGSNTVRATIWSRSTEARTVDPSGHLARICSCFDIL